MEGDRKLVVKKTTVKKTVYNFNRNDYYTINTSLENVKTEDFSLPRVIKWGTLKLFLAVMQFFNCYVDFSNYSKIVCVYVGAAPGLSVTVLNKFYPMIEYHLYDPSGESDKKHERFDDGLRNQPNIELYPQFFTDEDAEKWRLYKVENPDVGLYFISDIRNRDVAPDPGVKDTSEEAKRIRRERDAVIFNDMEGQQRWVKIINPTKALLKFRLQQNPDKPPFIYEYLDGMIFRQAYNDGDSYETRLVPVDNITTRKWDALRYEGAINKHNRDIRNRHFRNSLTGDLKEIDPTIKLANDFDSLLFVEIVKDYLAGFGEDIIPSQVIDICRTINRELTTTYDKYPKNLTTINRTGGIPVKRAPEVRIKF